MKKIAGSKSNTKLNTKSKTKSNTKSNAKSYTKTNSKLNSKTDSKSYTKSEAKPYTKSDKKPLIKSRTKPDTKSIVELNPESTVTPDTKPKRNTKHRPERLTLLVVDKENELLKFLVAQLPQEGRNSVKSLLAHGQVSVDGDVITLFNYPLGAGQKVRINRGKVYQERNEHKPRGLRILFEDDYLVIIEKPAGMLSIATDREKESTAYHLLSTHIKKKDNQSRIFVVHRLDRETSGVMMFAKSEEIKDMLQNAWKEVVLERSYIVVVNGSVADDQGTITSWLTENKALKMYSSNTPNAGQKAVTHYKVLQKNNSYSLLEVKLETGRKNQIRIHMQDLGHSVIGDIKYGGMKSTINRLGLHAHILSFRHPVTNEIMRFESPIPKEFSRFFHK